MNIGKYIHLYSEELKRKGYRNESIKNYVSCVSKFLHHFDKMVTKPTEINEQNIKQFLGRFPQHNTQRAYHSAIKGFYKYVVKQPKKFRYIEYCKRNRRLPIVLSVGEIQKLINSIENLKHKTIICLMYSTGVRIGELVNLKIEDIDSKRMIIRIRDGKGGKDREVTLDLKLLNLLRSYYIKYKPTIYLFNGDSGSKYSQSSVRQIIKKYGQLSGITKKLNPHLLRHCYGTHLVESGTDINLIQRLMGHNSVKTTNLYLHISNNLISKIKTPLSTMEI